MALGASASLLLGWAVIVNVGPEAKAPARPVSVREQLAFSMPVGLTRFVQIGNAKLDKYVVMTVFAEAAYGTYYLGAAELPIPSMICTAVMSVMMAELVGLAEVKNRERLIDFWHQSIRKIALVTLPFFCFAMIFAGPIFVALYGAAHEDAAQQFRIFQLLLLARVTHYSSISLALGQPRVPFVAALIALSLNATLSLVAVRTVGLSGPAWANVASICISTVYTLWAIRRSLGVPWSRLFPLRSYLQTLGVASAALLPAAGVLMLELPAWLTVLAGALVYLVAYVYLGQASALIGAEDRAFLRGVVKLRFLLPRTRAEVTG
jgi:O-antigen/teichoic acid export membrane protein